MGDGNNDSDETDDNENDAAAAADDANADDKTLLRQYESKNNKTSDPENLGRTPLNMSMVCIDVDKHAPPSIFPASPTFLRVGARGVPKWIATMYLTHSKLNLYLHLPKGFNFSA